MSEQTYKRLAFMAIALIFFVSVLIIIRWTITFITWTTLDSGWAQTIGALIGLAIAIWVPSKQKADAVKADDARREREQARICMAFRDELTILKSRFNGPNIVEILRDVPNEFFDREIPIPATRFPIFNALIGSLTDVDDAAIRHGIIDAYGYAHGLIDVAAMNNRRLLAYVDLDRDNRRLGQPVHANEMQFQMKELIGLRLQMRDMAIGAIDRVDKVLLLLEREAARHN